MIEDRRITSRAFMDKLFSYWQLWLVLLAGCVAGMRFYFAVEALTKEQAAWKLNTDQRRDKSREENESIRSRILALEKDMEWIKNGAR